AEGHRARIERLLPLGAMAREIDLRATVVQGVQIDAEGRRRLVVREREGAARIALTVNADPRRPVGELDQVTTGDEVRVWCRLRRPRSCGNPGCEDVDRALRGAGLD